MALVAEPFTADELVKTGYTMFRGLSAKASTAAVTVTVRNGTSTAGAVVAILELASGVSGQIIVPDAGIRCDLGLFVDITTAGGTVEGACWYS